MTRIYTTVLLALTIGRSVQAQTPEPDVTFRSDTSLVRVDAQVLDQDRRAITGLRIDDFVLRDENKRQKIRNFASEDLPVDIVFLFDVSTSMRPHIQRVASAAGTALHVLGNDDRVAIMVFDRSTRLRSPFRNSRNNVEGELNNVIRHESFSGGTDITRGLIDAADYVRKNARKEARRAIVIVTDDQTEFERNDERVSQALQRADAVLSALLAPDAMNYQSRIPGMGRGGSYPGGGGYPGGGYPGGGYPGGGGGVILGRRPGYGGGRMPMPMPGPGGGGGGYPGGGYGGSRTRSAGTGEIAERSGGDSLPVDDSSALETTLARIRQRYALFYNLPAGARPGEERSVSLDLAADARRRYPDAEVRFRRVYMTPDNIPAVSPSTPSDEAADSAADTTDTSVLKPSASSSTAPPAQSAPRRRPNVIDESTGPRGPLPSASGGWRRADTSDTTPADPPVKTPPSTKPPQP